MIMNESNVAPAKKGVTVCQEGHSSTLGLHKRPSHQGLWDRHLNISVTRSALFLLTCDLFAHLRFIKGDFPRTGCGKWTRPKPIISLNSCPKGGQQEALKKKKKKKNQNQNHICNMTKFSRDMIVKFPSLDIHLHAAHLYHMESNEEKKGEDEPDKQGTTHVNKIRGWKNANNHWMWKCPLKHSFGC